MVTFPIRLLSVAVAAYTLLSHVGGTPIENVHSLRNAPLIELKKNATPSASASHWVIYSDQYVGGNSGPPDPSAIEVCAVLVRYQTLLIPYAGVQYFVSSSNVSGVCV